MRLSVVIVNYNVKYFLEQCLQSVRKASMGLSVDVWVVDNHSLDGSVEMVSQRFPEVHIIANLENVGFSKANNQAIRASQGEYVLLLNPDTIVEEDTFRLTLEYLDQHPDAGGLGVKMIDGNGKFLPESKRGLPSPKVALYKMAGLNKLFPRSKEFGAYHLGYLSRDEIHQVDVLSGAFMMIRRSVLDKIGLLDEDYFMYGEDIDLSYRITQGGFKNIYFPKTTIIHYKGESTKKTSVNYVLVFYRAMVIFANKHFSRKNAGVFNSLINLAIYLRAGLALVHRAAHRVAMPLLDFTVLFGGMFLLKETWETWVRYPQGGNYPPQFAMVNIPVYAACWVFGIFLTRGYERGASGYYLLRGIILGTLIIAVLYAFASDEWRFSRALILLGMFWALGSLTLSRILANGIRYKTFSLKLDKQKTAILVAGAEEAARVNRLIDQLMVPMKVTGFVVPDLHAVKENGCIGTLKDLPGICELVRPDAVVFCSKDIAVHDMIRTMGLLGSSTPEFKMVPQESRFIIGSNSKDKPGEFYTIDLSLEISRPANRRLKRLFDIIASLVLLPVGIFICWFNPSPYRYFKNIFSVLQGRMTLVGYAGIPEKQDMPSLKPGVLSPATGARHQPDSAKATYRLNMMYARDYRVEQDLWILLRGLLKIG